MATLSVLGMGYYHPETTIDNAFIEGLGVDTTAEWIIEKIGIHSRRSTLPLSYIKETKNLDPSAAPKAACISPAEMGIKAAQMALERCGIKPQQIGLVLCNCCTPTRLVPSEAQRIAKGLGINATAYDVLTACPVFALHIDYLNNLSDSLPEYVLCVSTATLTQNVNYTDRTDGAIWGDGAAAWIVSAQHPGKLKVLDTYYTTDPTRCDAVVVDTFGFFHQDGRAVRDFSVRQTVRLIKNVEAKFSIDWTRDVFIGHQANATMLEQIINNRGIPAANHWHNVETIGNQAGASAPATLAMHWNEIKPGQKIVVAVVGAGLSWGSVVLEGQ